MIKYKITKDFKQVEKARKEVYNINYDSGYYMNLLKEGKIVALSIYDTDFLIGSCYVSNSCDTLYIEQIFIKEPLQKQGYGTKLLKCVIDNKELFENYFKTDISMSRFEPTDEASYALVKKMGYRKTNGVLGTMKKNI